MSPNSQLFYSIVSGLPDAQTGGRERRRSFRRPVGTIAIISRLIDGIEHHRLSVLVMNCGERGVGIRSPIGLTAGAVYRLHIGRERGQSVDIQITSSRRRDDDAYDVGACEIGQASEAVAA